MSPLLLTLTGMVPVFSVGPVFPAFTVGIPPPCRLRALSRRRRLLLSRCSLCLFCTSIRAVMNVFFTSFSNSSSSRRASWLTSSSEYSRMAASTRCSSSTSAELGIRLRPAEQMKGGRDNGFGFVQNYCFIHRYSDRMLKHTISIPTVWIWVLYLYMYV